MQIKRVRKRRYAVSIGGAFLLLTIIGIVTVVLFSLRLTGQVLDNSTEKEQFARLIQPVMMFDPAPFEKPQDISMNNLLLYSMWSALMSERAATYTYNENQELLIPASDLDVAATNLFGSDVVLEHYSFGDYDYDSAYSYDSYTKTYSVRISVHLYVSTPEVRDVVKDGDFYRLDVHHVPAANAWSLTTPGQIHSPFLEKHMYYYLVKTRNGYQLAKIQYPPSAQAMQTTPAA